VFNFIFIHRCLLLFHACIRVSNLYSMRFVFVAMAALQLEGKFVCLCCVRPFSRRGNLLRHLSSLRLKGEHEEYYSIPKNAGKLRESSGISWESVRRVFSGFDEPSILEASVATVTRETPQPRHTRTFYGPEGRRRLESVVESVILEAETINDVVETFDGAGMGLYPDEVEVASIVCSAAAKFTAGLSRRYTKLLRADTDLPGAAVERRSLRRELRRLSHGMPDLTVDSDDDYRSFEVNHLHEGDVVASVDITDSMSDVEPNSEPESLGQVEPLPQPSSQPTCVSAVHEVITIDSEDEISTPLDYQLEDVTPVDSPTE
jgi:hypothetical protein